MTICCLVYRHQRFGGICFFHVQDRRHNILVLRTAARIARLQIPRNTVSISTLNTCRSPMVRKFTDLFDSQKLVYKLAKAVRRS
jgi:hypothetical protein